MNKTKIAITALLIGILIIIGAISVYGSTLAQTPLAKSIMSTIIPVQNEEPAETPTEIASTDSEASSDPILNTGDETDKALGLDNEPTSDNVQETEKSTSDNQDKTAKPVTGLTTKKPTEKEVKKPTTNTNKNRPRAIASRGVSSRGFIWPVQARISSYYGQRNGRLHKGLDLALATGHQIKAVRAGTVIYSGWVSGYGETVIIDHGNGITTLYGHNSKLLVKSGQRVDQGEVITLSGNTGRSTGPHLHFEILINGQAVNPVPYLP